jgi:hypothetical protein
MNTNKLLRRIKLATNAFRGEFPQGTNQHKVPQITAEEIAEIKAFFPLDKFFIFGHARSGTTLLTRLVRVHPKVHCNYQAHFFTRPPLLQGLVSDERIGEWLSRRSNRWNQGKDMSPLVLRAASDFIMERDAHRVGKGTPDCVVGDKSPNNLLNGASVRLMMKVYPDARLIFIVRDGRDAVLSHRFQTFIDKAQNLSPEDLRIRQDFAQNPAPYLEGQKSIFTEKGLRNSAKGWVKNVVETDAAAKELLADQYYALRYEDLLENPPVIMNNIWAFLSVDTDENGLYQALEEELTRNPDADWQRQKADDIAHAVEKGKSGNWHEFFTPRDKDIFQEIAGDTLAKWGYTA